MNIELDKVTSVEQYKTGLVEDLNDFIELFEEAKSEITYYDWCLEILESYIGIFFAGIVGVFLFKIKPSTKDIDEWIWVIVGDIPPTYITGEDSLNAACALDSYIGAMQEWVEAAEKGDSVAELVPVNVTATPENAKMLKTRLTMLDDMVLSQYMDDLNK